MELYSRLGISLEAMLLDAHIDLPDRAHDADAAGTWCVVKPETAAGTTVRRTTDAARSAVNPDVRRRNLLLIIFIWFVPGLSFSVGSGVRWFVDVDVEEVKVEVWRSAWFGKSGGKTDVLHYFCEAPSKDTDTDRVPTTTHERPNRFLVPK